jgi:hypothetical protein
MIRSLYVMMVGLSLFATLSMAQVPDSITEPAALPRTEAEFLARYGANDSNRALIKYYFARRRDGFREGIVGIVLVGGGITWLESGIKTGYSSLGTATLAGSLAIVGAAVTTGSLMRIFRHNAASLRNALASPEQIPPSTWRNILGRYGNGAPTTAVDAERHQQEYWKKRRRKVN